MKSPLTADERLERIRLNARQRVPRLRQSNAKRDLLSICGFGPSLADTWKDITGDVLTTSGAHDFLISRGVIPKFHVEMDARPHKVNFVRRSHPDVTYLIASHCHPEMFKVLAGRKVKMWHAFTDDDTQRQVALLAKLEDGARLVAGGTNVGMRALLVAREMGYTRFELHGMDCCYRGEQQWAGEHYTAPHHAVEIEVEGRKFVTSDLMMQSTDDFFNQMGMLRNCSFRIHGDGLLEARMQMFMRDREKALNVGWWKPLSFTLREDAPIEPDSSETISDEYRAMNAAMHLDYPTYGRSGHKRVRKTTELCAALGTKNVLDYGCGKGTLSAEMPFPISEYDPCVSGKDDKPSPADLVVCSDVLEHVEPECLHAVLADLKRLALRGGYFVVHTCAAQKSLPDGRNAHLIQRPLAWWSGTISQYFSIDAAWSAIDGEEAHFVVSPLRESIAA